MRILDTMYGIWGVVLFLQGLLGMMLWAALGIAAASFIGLRRL